MSNSKLMVPRRIRWPDGPSIRQHFSLPPSIIYYIAKNPSNSRVYSKLIKMCKFFFEKLPILVAADMYYSRDDEVIKICPDKECVGDGRCCVEFDIKKTVAHAWLTHLLYLSDLEIPYYTSLLCSKVYQNLKILVPYVSEIELCNVEITNVDGSCVMLETIIETMHDVEALEYTFKPGHSVADGTTMKKIAALGSLGSLKSFRLQNIFESFKVQDLSDFIMNYTDIKFWFSFGDNLSDGYKAQLDALIDTVIESYAGCVIEYNDQDDEKLYQMFEDYYC